VPTIPTSPKVCACTTLGNLKCQIEPSTQKLSVHFDDFIPPALWPPNSQDLNPVDYTVWSVLQERVYRTKISDVNELKRRIISEWAALWVTRLLTELLKRGVSVYALAFMLEADILSTRWNKDCVMWHVPQWLFWETITVSHVCCYSVNHLNGDKCTLNYCVNCSIWHFKFSKVVRAHTLGEVGILGTVLLRVSSGTILTIFTVIGSYLSDREQKISWHSFLDTVYTMWVKKIPREDLCQFFQNGFEFFNQILYAYYAFLSTLNCEFLFNYLQLWRSYAILSVTTQFTSCAQNVNQPKRIFWHLSH